MESPLIIFYTILFTTRKKHEIKKLICYHRYCISIVLTGCKEEKKADAASTSPTATSIKVGVMAGPEHQVAETAAKVAKDKYNLNVEFVLFNDYALPNTAVSKVI